MNLKAHAVDVPEFGDGVTAYIAELTAHDRDERLEVPWLKHREETGDTSNAGFRAFAVAACLCDESRKFQAESTAEIFELAGQLDKCDSRPVTRLFNVAVEANDLNSSAEDAKKN